MNFRTLKADEIDVKVGNVTKTGYTLLLYKNARVDMAILDETVKAENWQRDHKEVKGNLYCGIGIFTGYDDNGDLKWVWKWDCGVESAFGDKEKGEASDSFKRAGFNWGIGRELYTSPVIKIDCETTEEKDKSGKVVYKLPSTEKYRTFRVKEIECNENKEITKLVIVDNKGVQVFPKHFEITKENATITASAEEVSMAITKQKMNEVVGGSFTLRGGKYDGKTIDEVLAIDEQYIRWCIDNGKNEIVKQNMMKALTDCGLEPNEVLL